MKRMKFFLTAVLFVAVLLLPITVLAGSVATDGKFQDWSDKPSLEDTQGDESSYRDIVMVKWFPDPAGEDLFIYCERLVEPDSKEGKSKSKDDDRFDENYDEKTVSDNEIYEDIRKNFFNNRCRFKYWVVNLSFKGAGRGENAWVFYHPPSRKVFVMLFDKKGSFLWSAGGKWGDDRNTARRIEFYIPLSYIAGSTAGGYQVDMRISSGNDRVPGAGYITISTISTLTPALTAALLLLPAGGLVLGLVKTGRRRKS